MKAQIKNLELDVRNAKAKNDFLNERFVAVMEPFFIEARVRYETLECMLSNLNDAFKDLSEFYTFDPSKYQLGEFFSDIKVFSQQFQQCHLENLKQKETDEKQRRSEEEKAQREKEKQARKTQKENLMKQNTDDLGDTGVMDNLLEALQSGKLFENGGGTPGSNSNSGLGRGGRRPVRRDHNGNIRKPLLILNH